MLNPIRPRPLSWMSVLIAPVEWPGPPTFPQPPPFWGFLVLQLQFACDVSMGDAKKLPSGNVCRTLWVRFFPGSGVGGGFWKMTVQWKTLHTAIFSLNRSFSLYLFGQDKHVNFEKCKNSIIRFNVLFIPSGKETKHTHSEKQLEF